MKNTNSNGDYPASGCSGLGYFYSVANHGLSQEQLAFDFAILIVLPLISTLTFFLLKLSVKINKDYFMFKLFPFQWNYRKIKPDEISGTVVKVHYVQVLTSRS